MRLVRLALLFALAPYAGTIAHAATPENAPPESNAQVETALRTLRPAFPANGRRIPRGQRGTIEFAIASYAPAKFHPVEEGALRPSRAAARCPAEMADVGARFCIDRHEGSLLERLEGGATQGWPPYTPPLDGHMYLARSSAGVIPQAYISAAQSEAACRAAGKRLCHAVEWRAACGGSQGYAYPYGPRRIERKCHDTGVAPMLVFFAAEMKKGWGRIELNDPRLNQLEGTVAKTGAFADCVNDYGVYDMVGNLHEWTADPNGTFQGGYWLDTAQHGDGCAYRTIAHQFTYHDYSTGFRCCADSEL